MDHTYGDLEKRAKELKRIQEELVIRLTQAPKGSLKVVMMRGRPRFYCRESSSDRNGKYLGEKDGQLIAQLAQKNNDELELTAVRQELEAIQGYMSKFPKVSVEEVYERLHPAKKTLVTPSVETDEMFLERWKKKYHTDESFSRGRPEFVTDRGELVRSKSEVIIANTFNRLAKTYCYEPALIIPGRGTFHPDFAAPNIRRHITVFLEHLGLMDDPDYADTAVSKQNIYILSGYYPGDQLIITMETQNVPLNIQALDLLLRKALS